MKRKNDIISGQRDIAVALHYDGDKAPRVTAQGSNAVAERIIARAEDAGVPLYPDTELALVLSQVPMGDEIPDNLYKAIAEVIAFAYVLAGKFPEGFATPTEGETAGSEDVPNTDQ